MTTTKSNSWNTSILQNRTTISGILMLIIGSGFLTVMMLSAAIVEDYNFKDSAISDLGVYNSTEFLFNIGLILVGIINMSIGYLLYIDHEQKGLFTFYILAGIGAIGTGIFPLDTGDMHSLFAILAFVFFNVQAIGTKTIINNQAMRILSLILGGIGLIYFVIMFIGDGGNPEIFGIIGHGGSERMIVYPPMIWLTLMGGFLLGKSEVVT